MKRKIIAVILVGVLFPLWGQASPASLTSAKHEQRVLHRRAAAEEPADNALEVAWREGKKTLQKIGLDVGVDISYLPQRVSPEGKQTSVQGVYYPYLTWNLFTDRAFGSGQVNANYTLAHYWGAQAATLQARANQAVAFNDYSANQEIFSQLSYTHTLPGKMDWLSFTLGQFPIYNFDGTNYLDNQQTALMNFALSQNATSVYPSASLGAYVQAQSKAWTFAAGYQDATNVSGKRIETDTAFDGNYTAFGFVSYAPQFKIGAGQYSVLYYYQPSVKAQPADVNGWSVNMQQNMGEKWVLFGRANGSDKNVSGVKNSYALGAGLLNPFDRNANDAILLGVAYNRLSRAGQGNPASMRTAESAVELAWVWGIGKLITLTSDMQLYPRVGLNKTQKFTTVVGIRTTVML